MYNLPFHLRMLGLDPYLTRKILRQHHYDDPMPPVGTSSHIKKKVLMPKGEGAGGHIADSESETRT